MPATSLNCTALLTDLVKLLTRQQCFNEEEAQRGVHALLRVSADPQLVAVFVQEYLDCMPVQGAGRADRERRSHSTMVHRSS